MNKKIIVLVSVFIVSAIIASIMMYNLYMYKIDDKSGSNNRSRQLSNVYYLKNKPGLRDIIPMNSNNTYSVAAYIDIGQSIDLDWIAQQLENNGFQVSFINSEEGFLDYSKPYYTLPSLCNGDSICPVITVNGRVYSNGTIIAYVILGPDNIGLLGYLDSTNGRVIPVTGKTIIDILGILDRQDLSYYVQYAMPSHPDAKYIIFIYPSTDWIEYSEDYNAIEVNGYYTLSDNATVLVAGFIHLSKAEWATTYGSKLYIDNNLISYVRVGEHETQSNYGPLPIDQYFQPGSTHNVKFDVEQGQKAFFLITVITA